MVPSGGCSLNAASGIFPWIINFLLPQEKNGDQKGAGARGPDFKTLADVLIQETVRHDLGMLYPDLRDHIMVSFIDQNKFRLLS